MILFALLLSQNLMEMRLPALFLITLMQRGEVPQIKVHSKMRRASQGVIKWMQNKFKFNDWLLPKWYIWQFYGSINTQIIIFLFSIQQTLVKITFLLVHFYRLIKICLLSINVTHQLPKGRKGSFPVVFAWETFCFFKNPFVSLN